MDLGRVFRGSARTVNKAMLPLLRTGVGKKLFGGSMAVVTYRGRTSGKEFTLPVGYKRTGQQVTIPVMVPDAKTWWRNFLGVGAPMTLTIGPTSHDAHAVAHRDDKGGVTVQATLA